MDIGTRVKMPAENGFPEQTGRVLVPPNSVGDVLVAIDLPPLDFTDNDLFRICKASKLIELQ